MYNTSAVITVIILYVGLLFLLALWVERGSGLGKRLAKHPLVYALALAVYGTSWTFYGSVGSAASSGMLFLTIYLGPTLMIGFWWIVLRKLVRIKAEYHVTSIADFISARYGKSQTLAAIATLLALVGTTPYIALQLEAVTTTFSVITGNQSTWLNENINLIVVGLMIVFTIIFGVRRLDPTERHEGIVTALAVESLVKLVAFLAVGIFVTFFLYDGFGDIFQRLAASPYQDLINAPAEGTSDYLTWMTYLILAMSAILFLPRQFHVAVVENSSENHIRTAIWALPLYLFLINIFVMPIAAGGLLQNLPLSQADSFVLLLPLQAAQPWLALLVFLGGFSAATSMIIVSAMTMATMATNHLLLPATNWNANLTFLRRYLLQARWVVVFFILVVGFIFERALGDSYTLVNMGLISFAAVLQFAPSLLGGIFWRQGNRQGAILGLSAGFLVWAYTLFLPSFAKSGWLPAAFVENGPWGIAFLRPEQLFGLTGLPELTHMLIWTMFFNIGFYVLGSLYFSTQDETEIQLANEFVDILSERTSLARRFAGEATIDLAEKIEVIRNVLSQYMADAEAEAIIQSSLRAVGIITKDVIAITELAELQSQVEKLLAGSTGAAAAHHALKRSSLFRESETRALAQTYRDILAELRVSPEELQQRIDFYRERDALLTREATELEEQVAERTKDLEVAAKVSRRISTILDTEQLVQEVVTQIQHAFDYYHVHIYLFDEEQESLEMVGGTGAAANQILAAGHKLASGQGLVGRAGTSNRPVLVSDVLQDSQWLPNPLLPDTVAEIAIPISIGDQVLGVLDVQHDEPGVLTKNSTVFLQSMANQIAVALQNARQVERTLETQQRFTLAVAGTNDGIWDWDIPNDEVYFSPRWKEMIGYEDHELANDFSEFERRLHPDDHDRMMQALADYLAGETNAYEHEFRMQHKDGSYRWILVRAEVIRDKEGNPLRMAGSHRDITARKQSEAELREEQERTETILRSVTIPMLISRVSDGGMLYVNEHLAEIVRVSVEELMNQGTPDFYTDPDDRKAVITQIQERGFINNYELRLKRATGDAFWGLLSARLINFAGEPAIVTSLIDITDHKQAQAMQEKQAADLKTVADVSTRVAASLEQESLLQDVVDLTKERFDLYHAHIYLIDETGENLMLTAGAGEVGRQLVAEEHAIPVAQEQSLVARAARSRQGVIINNVEADPSFLPNPLLPDTRAEMAVPMIAGDQLLGVLDVQADETDYFSEQDARIQTTLATQTAVALQNARQYQATGKALDEANTFRQLVAASGQAIGIANLDGNAVYANPAMLKLLGANGDTMPAPDPSIFSFYPPDIQVRFSEEIIPTVMEQGQWQGELRLATSDGEIPTYENYFLLRDEAGNPAHLASIITDISAQKENEIVLAQNQAQLQQAMRAARLANWQFDVDTQRFIFNEQVYDLLGTDEEAEGGYTQPLTQFIEGFVHRGDRDLVTNTVTNLLANPEIQSVEEEIRMRHADGTIHTMLVRFEVNDVAAGEVLSLIGTVQDITAQKEAQLQQEKLARQLGERLEQLNAMQRAMTREGWKAFLTASERPVQGFRFAEDSLQPVEDGDLNREFSDTPLDFDAVSDVTLDPQKSTMAIPLNLHGETIGVIGAHSESGEALSEEQQLLLEALSAEVAEALERARLFEETELNRQRLDQRANELQAVAEISTMASTALETRQLLDTFARLIKDRLNLYHCNIFTVDELGESLHMVASSWQVEEEPERSSEDFTVPLHQEQSLVAEAVYTRRPVLVNDVDNDPHFLPMAMMPHTQAELSLPLIAGGQVVGVLDVHAREKDRFSEEDVRIHETLAAQIAVSWQNAQLYTATQRRAEREAMINTISQKIQNAATVQSALQTAVSELGRALNARQAQVRVKPSSRTVKGNGADDKKNGQGQEGAGLDRKEHVDQSGSA